MIMISVTGKTYQLKETLKRNGFQWNPKTQAWWKMVGVSLNATLEAIRPEVVTLQVTLFHVDLSGKQLSEKVLRFKLKPEGARAGTDYYEEFQAGICDDHVITVTESPAPPVSEKKEKPRTVDEGFF